MFALSKTLKIGKRPPLCINFPIVLMLCRLALLFNILDVNDHKRYDIYVRLVRFCGKSRQMNGLIHQVEQQVRATKFLILILYIQRISEC